MKLTVTAQRNPGTGKPVTVISGIIHNPGVIEDLASKLKSRCGAGGHIEGKSIIIQGSHTEKVKKILRKDGYEF